MDMDDDKLVAAVLSRSSEEVIIHAPIKPVTAQRVRDIRDIVRRKYNLPLFLANKTAAALFGFRTYENVRAACFPSEHDTSFEPADEDCTARHIMKRRSEQAEVLVSLLGIERREAKELVVLLRPSSRDWKPSLRRQSPFSRRASG
jgi:hypothetical protein